jgi:hypothetical protein
LESHLGRKKTGEKKFISTGQSDVKGSSVNEPFEIEDDGLVDPEVDDLVETGRKFNCSVKGVKYGT